MLYIIWNVKCENKEQTQVKMSDFRSCVIVVVVFIYSYR